VLAAIFTTEGKNYHIYIQGFFLTTVSIVLNTYKNNEKICASTASYGVSGGHSHGRRGLERRQGNGPAADGKEHIREMSTCKLMGPVKPTDQIWIDAEYDYQKHKVKFYL
jgi:hypothetical protein